jgi:hypothetical protein
MSRHVAGIGRPAARSGRQKSYVKRRPAIPLGAPRPEGRRQIRRRVTTAPRRFCDVVGLQTTYDSVDQVAGLADRHTSKLICGIKRYGPMSLTATLGALGLALVVVEDTEQFQRIRGRLATRRPGQRPGHGPLATVETPPSESRHANLYLK